jgi:hypothetical protein
MLIEQVAALLADDIVMHSRLLVGPIFATAADRSVLVKSEPLDCNIYDIIGLFILILLFFLKLIQSACD